MDKQYNLYNFEASFKDFLIAGNTQPVSIKNYLSDLRYFLGWLNTVNKSISTNTTFNLEEFITVSALNEFKTYMENNNLPHASINRRLSTLRKFCSFCIIQGWMKENPAKQVINISSIQEENKKELEHDLANFDNHLENIIQDQNTIKTIKSDVEEFLTIIN